MMAFKWCMACIVRSLPCAQRGRSDFCHYRFSPGSHLCPHEDQDRLLQHFLDRAANGSRWASNMLQLTPCDVWPFIRGRTIWLMGDSITQVGCNPYVYPKNSLCEQAL